MIGFYLQLTDLGPSGNHVLRSICAMASLVPVSGRENGTFPQLRTGRTNAGPPVLGGDLGVRPGESDATQMLAGVLLFALATITTVLALLWWLT